MNEVRVLSLLLGALLIASYVSWFRDDAPAVERVTLIDAKPRQLERIVLETPTATTTLEMRADAWGERYAWIEHDHERGGQFVGGERVDQALDGLFPLQTLRVLGDDLSQSTLKDIQLDPPAGRMQVQAAGKTHTFDIGTRTNGDKFGDFYARVTGDSEVFLLDGRGLEAIQRADRGRQRTLRAVEKRDVAKVVVSRGDASFTILQQNRGEPDAFFALESEPESKSEDAASLMKTVLEVTLLKFPEPEPTTPADVTRFTWFGPDGSELGWAEIGRSPDPRGDGLRNTHRARSPETHRWAEIADAAGRRALQLATELGGFPALPAAPSGAEGSRSRDAEP